MVCIDQESLVSQTRVRLLRQEDLFALEWEGEYRHFRRLYREIFESSRQGKAILWVAELPSGQIIGQVFVQLVSGRKELADGVQRAYVYGFRVRPQYRNCGVGKRMLETLESDLKRRGFRYVTLNVGRDNPNAQRFYQRHEYHVVAAEPGRWYYFNDDGQKQEVNEPAWRMEKSLVEAR